MGIGNTTTSSAVASVLLDESVETMTGERAGLDSAGLRRKICAIKTAIAKNKPNADDPVDVLSKVGGFDLAGLVGIYLGGAYYHVPVIMDGFISAVAGSASQPCKCAIKSENISLCLMCPKSRECIFFLRHLGGKHL